MTAVAGPRTRSAVTEDAQQAFDSAMLEYLRGNYGDALAHLTEVIRGSGDSAEALYLAGLAHAGLGNREAAADALARAAEAAVSDQLRQRALSKRDALPDV